MKKYHGFYLAALMGLTCPACSDGELTDVQQTAPQQELEQAPLATGEGNGIAFGSTVAEPLEVLPTEYLDGQAALDTRATLSSEGALGTWATTDKISISDGTLNYTYLPDEASIDGASCSFVSKTGASFLTDGAGQDGTFYAFYPADAVLAWNGATVTTMVYTEQDYGENKENSGVMGPYMAAVATTTGGGANASFTFGHICSVVDVDFSAITSETVDAVSLYANSQVSIAGRMKYDANSKAATVSTNDATDYSYSTQSEMVRVSNIASDATFARFYLLPVAQKEGFTITVHTTAGNYYTKKSSTSVGTSAANADYLSSVGGVTSGTVCKPYYKKYNFGSASTARTQNWMAMVPGNVKFNFLSIPGAHDAATSGCTSYTSYTICQNITVAELLAKGCRAFDLRPHTDKTSDDGSATITHSSYSTNVSLKQALTAITSFLEANPTETAFVLIHEEDASSHSTAWSDRVWSTLNEFTAFIASYGWRGNLNPCRGKMVVIFRDAYADGSNTGDLGCGRVGWGSSFNAKSIMFGTGSGSSDSYTLWYQDEYDTSSESDKLGNLTNMLTNYIAANEKDATRLYVNNTNIAQWSLLGSSTANTTLANKVNTAVLGSSTFTGHTGRFGIMMTDFLFSADQKGDQMFDLIHKQNYKYVYKGRTRCAATSVAGTDTGVDVSSDEYADGTQVYVRKR